MFRIARIDDAIKDFAAGLARSLIQRRYLSFGIVAVATLHGRIFRKPHDTIPAPAVRAQEEMAAQGPGATGC